MMKIEVEAKMKENKKLDGTMKILVKGLGTRGRTFEGTVIRKFPKRIVIEFERMIYVKKYERYRRGKTKIHARLLDSMKDQIEIGDRVKIQECRPLSKIIHFVVIEKIKSTENGNSKTKENIKEKT